MRPWRRHDGYVLKAFGGTFAGVLVFFTLMIVVIDLSERLKQVRDNWDRVAQSGYEPVGALVRLYATLVPFVWLRLLPVAVPMAGAFALARLARHQELLPLVAGGVSARRVLLPMLVAAALIAGAMLAARATVVPTLNRENLALDRLFTKRRPDRIVDVKHVHDAAGGRLSVAAFQPLARRLEDAWITFRGDRGELASAFRYPLLAWDEAASAWRAPQGGERIEFARAGAGWFVYPLEPGAAVPLASSVTLLELVYEAGNSLGLSLDQTAELLRAQPDAPGAILRHHEQFTMPLSALLLLALTLPICFRLGPHNALPGLLVAGGVAALYYAATQVATDLALGGSLNPVVLAWLPTVVFGSLAAALYAGLRS